MKALSRTMGNRRAQGESAETGSWDRKNHPERTVWTGQSFQDRIGRKGTAGQPEKTGQLGQANQDRTIVAGKEGQPEQYSKDITAGTGQLGQDRNKKIDSWERSVSKGLPVQVSLKGNER